VRAFPCEALPYSRLTGGHIKPPEPSRNREREDWYAVAVKVAALIPG
jgi:hypothetical protein